MKVVLAINSPEPYFPPQVPPRLCYGKKYPYNRMDEIVEYIETEGKKHRYKTKEITTEFLKSIPRIRFTHCLAQRIFIIAESRVKKYPVCIGCARLIQYPVDDHKGRKGRKNRVPE